MLGRRTTTPQSSPHSSVEQWLQCTERMAASPLPVASIPSSGYAVPQTTLPVRHDARDAVVHRQWPQNFSVSLEKCLAICLACSPKSKIRPKFSTTRVKTRSIKFWPCLKRTVQMLSKGKERREQKPRLREQKPLKGTANIIVKNLPV